jgi:predicted N-acetyltransferase YhbS
MNLLIQMSDEIKFRQYEKGDEEQINNLLQNVFHPWPHFDLSVNKQEHWNWKYLDNPLHLSAVAVAEKDHIIIGCSHGFYLNIKIGNTIFLAQQGTDLAVREDFRGRGIQDKLVAIKEEIHKKNNVNLTYSLSGNPIVYKKDIKKIDLNFPIRSNT